MVARWTARAQAISATRTAPAILAVSRTTATPPVPSSREALATTAWPATPARCARAEFAASAGGLAAAIGGAVDCSGHGRSVQRGQHLRSWRALEGNCDTAEGCAFITGSCDDGLACNTGEVPARAASAAVVARWTAPARAISATRTAPAIRVALKATAIPRARSSPVSCDDGLACNTGETCTSGVCGGGGAVDCTGTGDQCNEDSTCDPGGLRATATRPGPSSPALATTA